jgi:hypothetical protein
MKVPEDSCKRQGIDLLRHLADLIRRQPDPFPEGQSGPNETIRLDCHRGNLLGTRMPVSWPGQAALILSLCFYNH